MAPVYRYGLVAAMTALMTLAALWMGQSLRANHAGESSLHVLLHHDLDLDAGQTQQIEALEHGFAVRRARIETEMRAANADLAAAITREHAYGPDVEKAIDRSHMAMGELQKATLQHVFAMRSLLRPDQTGRFDKAVTKALTSPPQD